ncbi:MAG: indole-3-glycerol phosphate synthase TrpC [Dehalococcoidales bacterium]|nr:indole-3-glycerol phosphate synthase TrpC [Dehalococcoidales bacterium]
MILDEIVANSRQELEERKKAVPLEKMLQLSSSMAPPLDLAEALSGDRVRLIAEVKKASPSKGLICRDFDPLEIARQYAANGAAAISVLTDNKFFQGSTGYLSRIHAALGNERPPLLRKDFIFDPYQVYESRACGADALLLITAILPAAELSSLLKISRRLKMRCLVEVHDENEVERALESGAEIIGINNRDLRTFSVNIDTTRRLRPLISADRIVVSESGIKDRGDIQKLQEWKVNAALVGESLVASGDIAAKMRELL